jgi:hypothetical protein
MQTLARPFVLVLASLTATACCPKRPDVDRQVTFYCEQLLRGFLRDVAREGRQGLADRELTREARSAASRLIGDGAALCAEIRKDHKRSDPVLSEIQVELERFSFARDTSTALESVDVLLAALDRLNEMPLRE